MPSFSLSEAEYGQKPFVDGAKLFIDGSIRKWDGESLSVTSPILDKDGNRIVIGKIAQMGEKEAVEAAEAAKKAWNTGRGEWPQMKLSERIQAIEKVLY